MFYEGYVLHYFHFLILSEIKKIIWIIRFHGRGLLEKFADTVNCEKKYYFMNGCQLKINMQKII